MFCRSVQFFKKHIFLVIFLKSSKNTVKTRLFFEEKQKTRQREEEHEKARKRKHVQEMRMEKRRFEWECQSQTRFQDNSKRLTLWCSYLCERQNLRDWAQ